MTRSEEELFAPPPARDGRFTVRRLWLEMDNRPVDDPLKDLEFLHRQMNEEVNSIEMCARNLVDFPDADWELRMEMARQCWDEARHVIAFRELFERRGGVVGQFPIVNFQYCIITNLQSLAGRLAVQNRSFEAAGLDAIQDGLIAAKRADDPEFTTLFEAQLADEMQHVRYANEWVKKLLQRGGPRTVFALARDVSLANEGLQHVSGGGVVFYPVADELRREAGFSDEEIEAARAQAGSSN
jgi:uncharacterized ferritin-like protein (DUF455 family)